MKNLLSKSDLDDVETIIVRAPLNLPNASNALQMMQQAFGAYRAVVADLGENERADA